MKKSKLLLILTFSLLAFNSCGVIVKTMALNNYSVKKNAIPPEFGNEDTVLLCILKGSNSRRKYTGRAFTKKYHGKVEFIETMELYSKKYEDVNKYRYVFDYNSGNLGATISQNQSTGFIETSTPSTSNYFMLDRKKWKNYNSGFSSGFYGKLLKAYAINLEKKRLESYNKNL